MKLNKALLILSFFLPFMTMFCSRTEVLPQKAPSAVVASSDSATIKTDNFSLLTYVVYPTEYSVSGVGMVYYYILGTIRSGFSFNWDIIPLAYFSSILGLILTFFNKRKLVFYLSVLNLACFLFIIAAIGYDTPSELIEFDFLLWGFWVAAVLSCVDVYLTRKLRIGR